MNQLTLEQHVKNIINDAQLQKKKYKILGLLNILLIGKNFKVKDIKWEPANKYVGQVFKIDHISSSCNDTVYFVHVQNNSLPVFDLLQDIEILDKKV